MDEQVNPTRMELINVKERMLLADKGHQLLKQKRDVLVIELMTILHTSITVRDRLNGEMKNAYSSLAAAESYHSIFELENIAQSVIQTQGAMVTVRNAMGVKLPSIKRTTHQRKLSQRGYSIVQSSAKVDESAENFEKALDVVLELAEKEVSMKKLLAEIEKTKRRVNALEYIMMPRLSDTRREITLKLDELERDNFVTLKSVKTHLERQETSPA